MKTPALLCLTAMALAVAPLHAAETAAPAAQAASPVLNPEVPAPSDEPKDPTAAELAPGTPLAVYLKYASIIAKDDATHKPMEELWPLCSPGMKKIFQEYLPKPDAENFLTSYRVIKRKCDLTKPVKFRSFVNDGDTVILEVVFTLKDGLPYEPRVNMKKQDGKWVVCTNDEQPVKYQKPEYR